MKASHETAQHVTTQRTSKPLKAQLFLSIYLMLFGGMACFMPWGRSSEIAGLSWAAFVAVAGAVWYVITKVMIWWEHG